MSKGHDRDNRVSERQPEGVRSPSDDPLMIVLGVIGAMFLLATVLVGALQLSPGCREWRAWKASKQGPGFHTMELMLPPFYCIGSRDPTP